MNPFRSSSFLGALLLLTACAGGASSRAPAPSRAAAPAPAKKYSAEERKWMAGCVVMTDTAWTAAQARKGGVTREKMRAVYAGTSVERLATATVDKVYKDDFQFPWDYAVGFFKECAWEMAKVPAERVELAAYCEQNVMIAAAAFDQKRTGAAREKVYQRFAAFKTETPRQVIDRVYASDRPRGEALMGEWNSCIGVLAE